MPVSNIGPSQVRCASLAVGGSYPLLNRVSNYTLFFKGHGGIYCENVIKRYSLTKYFPELGIESYFAVLNNSLRKPDKAMQLKKIL